MVINHTGFQKFNELPKHQRINPRLQLMHPITIGQNISKFGFNEKDHVSDMVLIELTVTNIHELSA